MHPAISADEPRTRVIIQSHDPRTRDGLRAAALDAEGQVTADLPIIDAFVTSVPTRTLGELKAAAAQIDGDVRFIPDRTFRLDDPVDPSPNPTRANLHVATRTVHLQEVWEKGYRGQGIGIAVIDTGIAPHKDFGERIVAFQDLVNFETSPYDDRGHGTHVAGIAAGDGAASGGKYCGAAPEASLIGIKVMDAEGSGELSTILQGIQWAVDNKETFNIKVINMSLGATPTGPIADDPLAQATAEATKAGILVVAAAGNKGPYPQTIDTPAAAPDVLAVGATVDYHTPEIADDKVAWYSSSGPTLFDHSTKPDLVAPGTKIATPDANGRYAYDTGTSMASPLVAGIAALMFQAAPSITPEDLKDALRTGSEKIRQYDENTQGKGVTQADRTLALVLDPPAPSPDDPPTA